MSFKKEPERPRDVELWVHSKINGRYKARSVHGYQADIDKEVKRISEFLRSIGRRDEVVKVKEVAK